MLGILEEGRAHDVVPLGFQGLVFLDIAAVTAARGEGWALD